MTWPLKENPSFLIYLFRNCLLIAEFSSFLFIILGCIRFICENTNDIVPSVEALLSCVTLSDCFLRISNVAFNTASMKDFIVDFYKNIYITENEDSEMCKKIKRSLVPTTIYTYSYILTLMCFCVMPIINPILGNEAELPCRILVDYDIENPIYYSITMFLICCISIWVFFFFSGEAFLWAICIVHLNARYKMLQFKFQKRTSSLMKTFPPSKLAFELRKNIITYFDRICRLNRFSKQFVKIYNFRLFVMISFSALTLCVVSFQIVESTVRSQFLAYLFWLIAKITELLIFGNLGGTIINTTNQISSMYYHSNWENIIYRSTDLKENILLLKHVHIAIALHRVPIQMTGSTFFVISLSTVEKILRLSGSYFAFLYTIKRLTMN